MKAIFKGISEREFRSRFHDVDSCLKFLAEIKWNKTYRCNKCGNGNFCRGKTSYSRRCTRCKHDESATAGTPFHGCKIPIVHAFEMAYMVCCSPEISSWEISRRFDIRQMTCWKFRKRIIECFEKRHEGNPAKRENRSGVISREQLHKI